ncbi:MAG: META domain-containing protein [Chitinophagaceae bacterium]|nr:MAG: META domain-containing protein [Chitinophagaceae bacterium]
MKHFIILPLLVLFLACSSTKKTTAKKEADNQTLLAETMQQKQAAGIDLFAKGSSPASWNLEIDFDRIIRFQSLDGTDYKSSPVPAVEDAAKQISVYTTRAGKANMVISLFKETCTDAITGEKFSRKITVEVDGKKYEGCGQYLSDANLEGKWIMEKIGSSSLKPGDFAKGLPELEFKLSSGAISGHDGCNRLSGTMEVQGNQVRFSPIVSTKMACPGNKAEYQFLSKISNQVATYFFKDGQLVLYLIDDSTLVLRKL